MTTPDPRLGRLLLLGENYGEYGAIASTNVGELAAAAISVGATPDTPSQQWKYDDRVMNEDALCLIEAGDWCGHAVADAHYGPESSHQLLERLHRVWANVRPTDIDHLAQMIEFLRQGDPALTDSETTLLVVVYDRSTRAGFGFSFGDSTFMVVGPGRDADPVNPRDNRYVSARGRSSLRHGAPFEFQAAPGDLLLTFTDGIDECNYRSPGTSVQPHHIESAVAKHEGKPLATADGLVTLALNGVDGYPGGEDNIALCCSLA